MTQSMIRLKPSHIFRYFGKAQYRLTQYDFARGQSEPVEDNGLAEQNL